ncbi:DUF4419 domain-containing protein [Pseudobacteroides cellulosolvens]|uniref:DUF4419 domain-containing protein n=1 Tax=Pseudobacteroides cellulosolvens ATCC 35603 = DSM 2933 TaxID=398512 RepID=A0A0L6JU44_9FIRM|nr:DUF4419 domain-containing protein [Pseudobacteroides cellulosolvens]KNY29190.1 Protein of unknown function DUF4419 [Pseudobacteroides cellulosolvens ATCC 35603 = DSM 2933]
MIIIDIPIRDKSDSIYDAEIDIKQYNNQKFIESITGETISIQFMSRNRLMVPGKYGGLKSNSLMLQSVHMAFADHIPISLDPEVIWYMITYEVAQHIKKNPKKYAGVFNGDPENKKEIVIIDDTLVYNFQSNWLRTINSFKQPLEDHISRDVIDLFVPSFSVTTVETQTAVLVSFMDAIQKYYDFTVVTRCHIPKVRLDGEVDDWKKLIDSTKRLSKVFDSLKNYFDDMIPVLEKLYKTAAGLEFDESFWTSIYKYEDASGGPYITGWITVFFAHEKNRNGELELRDNFDWVKLINGNMYSGVTYSSFPSNISVIPFKWDYIGTIIPMHFAAGIMGIDWDGFLCPKLGVGVIELE